LWIAAFGGYAYEVSVTGFAFVSPLLQDEVPESLPQAEILQHF
jgi:hypothetical protein